MIFCFIWGIVVKPCFKMPWGSTNHMTLPSVAQRCAKIVIITITKSILKPFNIFFMAKILA